MSLRYEPREREAQTILDWPRPARLAFMRSHAYRVLKSAVERYVAGEAAGGSVLISGHRGAGKTSLVARVVEDVAEETFDLWVDYALARDRAGADDEPPAPPTRALRRPLLVKLHGPSLVAALAQPASPPAAAEGAKEETPPVAPRERLAGETLKHVAVSLYRAMADEFSNCIANQAAAFRGTPQADRLYELAAQFRLETDQRLEPIAARDYWASFKAERRGILWPRSFFGKDDEVARDQGMREIQAMVTAAQCFRICANAISGSETENEANLREAKSEGKLGGDLARLAGQLVGVTIGGLAGYGLGAAGGAAVGAGLVGAASGVWSVTRSRKQEAKVEYKFIRDFSLTTLERDLPLVIERARHAGLAPIFVIDELDKVEDPDGAIGDLISRLKHLMTDYGFFCFLTGADYFDTVDDRLREGGYPREHTYFSYRLFISYAPSDAAKFLGEVIRVEPKDGADPGDEAAETLAAAMIVRLIMYRSRLNTVDMMRELANVAERELRDDVYGLVSSMRNRLAVAVQLAGEARLEQRDSVAFFDARPRLRQLAIDAVYRFARAWEHDASDFDPSPEALAVGLAKALGAKLTAPSDTGPARSPEEEASLDQADDAIPFDPAVSYLVERIGRTAFEELVAAAAVYESLGHFESLTRQFAFPLSSAVPELSGGLLVPVGNKLRLIYDARGRRIEQETADFRGLRETAAKAGRLVDNLGGLRLTLSDLVKGDLLPATIDWKEIILATVGDLEKAPRAHWMRYAACLECFGSKLENEIYTSGDPLESLLNAEGRLTWQLGLAVHLVRDMPADLQLKSQAFEIPGFPKGREVILWIHRVRKFLGHPERESFQFDWPTPRLPEQSICGFGWNIFVRAALAKVRVDIEATQAKKWTEWAKRVSAPFWYDPNRPTVEYEDLLLTALDKPPSCLFRFDLFQMTAVEWSRVALQGAQMLAQGRQPARPWLCLGGLAWTGFPESILQPLRDELRPCWRDGDPPPDEYKSISPAADGQPGKLVVFKDAHDMPPQTGEGPVLLLAYKDLARYTAGLSWLADRNVISEIRVED